jgi:hypothetical protein
MNLKMVNIVSLSIKGELLAFIFLFFFYGHSQNRNSDEIRKLNQQAIEFANKKNYEEARNLYNEILKLDPENRQAILHLMIVYEYEGKYQELSKFSKYEDLFTGQKLEFRFIFYMTLASIYEANETQMNYYFDRYRAFLTQINNLEEISLMDTHSLAAVYYRKKEYENALYFVEGFLKDFPNVKDVTDIKSIQFKTLYDMGKPDVAYQRIQEFLSNDTYDKKKGVTLALEVLDFLQNRNDCSLIRKVSTDILSDRFKDLLTESDRSKFRFLNSYYCGIVNEEMFHELQKINPNVLEPLYKHRYYEAMLYFYNKNQNESKFNDLIVKAKKDFPKHYIYEFLHANYYISRGENDKAKEFIKRCYTLSDVDSKIYNYEESISLLIQFFKQYYGEDDLVNTIKSIQGAKPIHLYSTAFLLQDYKLQNLFFDLSIQNLSDKPKIQAQIKLMQSIMNLNVDFSNSVDFIEQAQSIYPSNYYQLVYLFYGIVYNSLVQKSISSDATEMKNLVNQTSEGPKAILDFFNVFAHYHSGEIDKACQFIKQLKIENSNNEIDVSQFCTKEYSIQSHLQSGVNLILPTLYPKALFEVE